MISETVPSSHRMLPRRRACQAHAPLFEWTKLFRFQTRSLVSLSSTPSSSSPSSSSSVCLFFRGGLGVGEKPTCGELVWSTHRVPSPVISSQRFPFETFVEGSRVSTPERATRAWPIKLAQSSKESKISQRIVRRDGGPVQGRRPYTQPSRQTTAGGNAQSKGSSSRPRRAQCSYICGFCS